MCFCDGQSHIPPEFLAVFFSKLFITNLDRPQLKPASSHITNPKLGVFLLTVPIELVLKGKHAQNPKATGNGGQGIVEPEAKRKRHRGQGDDA